jgi:hypothetical protein
MRMPNVSVWRLVLAVSLTLFVGCNSQTQGPQPTAPVNAPHADVYTLDVWISSPISIVQYKSGEIEVFLPNVAQHTYGYLKGLNDCPMDQGRGIDYRLDFSASKDATTIDANHQIPDEVRIDNNQEPISIDPHGRRFNKIWFPAPKEIIPIHFDDDGLAIYKKGAMVPSGHLYPTQVALRYIVSASPKISLSSTSPKVKACPLNVAQLGNEMTITMGMGPVPGLDLFHLHAKSAFRAEQALFPPLKREMTYVKTEINRSERVAPSERILHHASDCQAPMLLVINADPAQLSKK